MSHYCPFGILTGLRGQKVVLRLGSNENLSRSSKQSPVKLQTKSDRERSGSVSSNSLRFITRSSLWNAREYHPSKLPVDCFFSSSAYKSHF